MLVEMSIHEQTFQEKLSKMASVIQVDGDEVYVGDEEMVSPREIFLAQLACAHLAVNNTIPHTMGLDENAPDVLIGHMRAAATFVMALAVPDGTNLLVHDYVVAVKRIFEPFLVLEAFTCDDALTVCENGTLYLQAIRVAFG